jgi:hypothetical protein
MLLLAYGCTGPQNNGYLVVNTDITYGVSDRSAREWRALMTALDRCHGQGYVDAQRTGTPETQCLEENGPDGCRRFAAHISWDCIGMGYQSN